MSASDPKQTFSGGKTAETGYPATDVDRNVSLIEELNPGDRYPATDIRSRLRQREAFTNLTRLKEHHHG
jgi:hypothetical protein